MIGCASEDQGGEPGGGYVDNPSADCGALGVVCFTGGLTGPLAVGASARLQFDVDHSGTGNFVLTAETIPANVFAIDDAELTAVAAGDGSVIASSGGDLVDWLFIAAAAPDELRIVAYAQTGEPLGFAAPEVQLLVGDQAYFAIEPYVGSQPLAGQFDLDLNITGDAVQIVRDITSARYRLVARQAGTSTIAIAGLALDATWTVEVLP